MGVKVGTRLKSQVSTCEVMIVKGSDRDAELLCAGMAMTSDGGDATKVDEGPALALGKRYSDEESGIEILVTKAGIGPLSFEGRDLELNGPKQLPASD